jgi:hypothetical protein
VKSGASYQNLNLVFFVEERTMSHLEGAAHTTVDSARRSVHAVEHGGRRTFARKRPKVPSPRIRRVLLATTALWAFIPTEASPQAGATGIDFAGLPAINFDADEGFGYGAIAEIYQYGDGTIAPYVWTLQPTVFLTTRGRRDIHVFFDAPGILPRGWRFSAFLGTSKQVTTPYYGVGNASIYDETLAEEAGPDPYYYRFGRTSHSLTFSVQKNLRATPLRGLLGGGVVRTTINPFPRNEGTTLYASEFGGDEVNEWASFLRGGLVWDTRDRQTGPSSGTWTELILQVVRGSAGADGPYLRWTVADRRYYSLGARLVFAHRYLLQGVGARAPVYDLSKIQSSFKQQQGLGGSTSARGIVQNRFVGRSLLLWNSELRWRVIDFRFRDEPSRVVLVAFLDQGRVWADGLELGEIFSDLHRGYGGGVRLGFGEDFTVAYDFATSKKTGLQIYIGLGYLY